MKSKQIFFQILFIGAFLCSFLVNYISMYGQGNNHENKLYHDGHGGFVYFPLGSISFADELINFTEGKPHAAKEIDRNPNLILGEPDYNMETWENDLTLGCGGTITVRFTDNALVDIPGNDLYVFEIGPAVEAMNLAISKDGISWIDIGKISGGKAAIDIADFVSDNDIFYYVKLTDLKSSCLGWPGADVDAVGAIGSAIQITLNNTVLFEIGKYDLKNEALGEIKKVINQLPETEDYKIEIEGHTDSTGTIESNSILSLNRANAVMKEFVNSGINETKINIKGYGESIPLFPNNSKENMQKNRRVNIIIKLISNQRKIFDVETNTIFMSCTVNNKRFKNGYPKAFNNETFPDVWVKDIDDALTLDSIIYFFKNNKCIAFNIQTKKADSENEIGQYFPGLWKEGIDAVVNMRNGKLIFFKGNELIQFDIDKYKSDEGYPKPIKEIFNKKWFENGIDCAINFGDGFVYFFKNNKFVMYNISKKQISPPLNITKWSNLWTDRVDGVFDFTPDEVYFFKNPE